MSLAPRCTAGSTEKTEKTVSRELIDEVAARVLVSFQESTTAGDKLQLRRAKPSIPRDNDRALLLDASDVMQKYDLDEGIRYRWRARCWEKYDEA